MIRDQRGMALFWVMILMLLIFPLAWVFMSRVAFELRAAVKEKHIKGARVLAGNMAMDLMRQFSDDPQLAKYDALHLERWGRTGFYAGTGRIQFTPFPNFTRRMIYLRAEGSYGMAMDQGGNVVREATARQRLKGVVKFVNDSLRFAYILPAGYAMTPDNAFTRIVFDDPDAGDGDVDAGVYAAGDLTLENDARLRVDWNSRPAPSSPPALFVKGDLLVKNNARVDTAVFCADVQTQGSGSTGARNAFVPAFDLPGTAWPEVNMDWYTRHYNYLTTFNETWVFSDPSATPGTNPQGRFTIVSSNDPVTGAPSGRAGTVFTLLHYADRDQLGDFGTILAVKDAHVVVRGPVGGRVTIASVSSNPNRGGVTVSDDFFYSHGGNNASWEHAIAVLASSSVTFRAPPASAPDRNLVVNGYFYVASQRSDSFWIHGPAGAGGEWFELYGALVGGVRVDPVTGFDGGRTLFFDKYLIYNRPPGLPEKPVLVMWKRDPDELPNP